MIVLIILGCLIVGGSIALSLVAFIKCNRVQKALLEVVGPELEIQKNEIIKIKKKL